MKKTLANYWEKKIKAYLHDPPEKALDLAWHQKRAEAYAACHAFEGPDDFFHGSDHAAAAADRLPWPTYHYLKCAFDGVNNVFKHPLGGSEFPWDETFPTADLAHEIGKNAQPYIIADDPRGQFFAYWRFWKRWACDIDKRFAFLPADTRLPDHTIWVHNAVVSAFQGCVSEARFQPALLLFHLGPVQSYIAQARRTLDLWSGSYLLSYLIGTGMKVLALELGPDHVIYPNLCGQPIFDLLLKKEILDRTRTSKEKSLWESLNYKTTYSRQRLLTPSLPNRFLALVPADRGAELARSIDETIRKTYRNIAEAVWSFLDRNLGEEAPIKNWRDLKGRFFTQSAHFLETAWQVCPFPERPDEAIKLCRFMPQMGPDDNSETIDPTESLKAILKLAVTMPLHQRDPRNYDCPPNDQGFKVRANLREDHKLDNFGTAWSALYQLAGWQLDAVRKTNDFAAWESGKSSDTDHPAAWHRGSDWQKDYLTGREEVVLEVPDDRDEAKSLNENSFGGRNFLRPNERLGATSLVKRFWTAAWLQREHGELFHDRDFQMPSTRSISLEEPFARDDGEDSDDSNDKGRYFAVLALDGDNMGKWVSGTLAPELGDQLADYPEDGKRRGAKVYFKGSSDLEYILEKRRPVSPSYHLQFSELLGNFARFAARRIVEAYNGRLIYAGGDDVLALLPALKAIPCARALRAAFRGETETLEKVSGAWVAPDEGGDRKREELSPFSKSKPGSIRISKTAPSMEGEPVKYPALVPGPRADVSAGIAVGHIKAPLQDVVREARAAEKRAKELPKTGNLPEKSALAVTVLKRSGETVHWAAKWDSAALELYTLWSEALSSEVLANRFPYRLIELVAPYGESGRIKKDPLPPDPDFQRNAPEILLRECRQVLERQSSGPGMARELWEESEPVLEKWFDDYRDNGTHDDNHARENSTAKTYDLIKSIIGLAQTLGWMNRQPRNKKTNSPVVQTLSSHE